MTTYIRAQKQQEYAHVYVCVDRYNLGSLFVEDGRLLAWTHWDDAFAEAGRHSMIVVGWFSFKERYLPRLANAPTAARIIQRTRRGLRLFHAEINASALELRNLNRFDDYDFLSASKATRAAMIARAKVWPEGMK